MKREGRSTASKGPYLFWQYGLILSPVEPHRWSVLWLASRANGERQIWDRWELPAQPGAHTAASIASDTWVAATELLERRTDV